MRTEHTVLYTTPEKWVIIRRKTYDQNNKKKEKVEKGLERLTVPGSEKAQWKKGILLEKTHNVPGREKRPTVTGREKGSMFLEVRKALYIPGRETPECTWKEKAQCNWKGERLSVPGEDKIQCTWKRKNAQCNWKGERLTVPGRLKRITLTGWETVPGRERGSPYLEGRKSVTRKGESRLQGRNSVTWKGESRLSGRVKVGYLEGRKSVTWKGKSRLPGREKVGYKG